MKLSVRTTSPTGSRWRAGMQFTTQPVEVEVTEAQAEALAADELLEVEGGAEPVEVEVTEAQAGPTDTAPEVIHPARKPRKRK